LQVAGCLWLVAGSWLKRQLTPKEAQSASDGQQATCNWQPATGDVQLATSNMRPATWTEPNAKSKDRSKQLMKIKIKIGKLSMDAELNETPTAKKIASALPIKTGFNTWGDEIYFAIPVTAKLDESAKEVVEVGDLGYWPTGKAFCIFFGQTPVSKPGKIMPASAVNMIGKVMGDATQFKKVMNESQVILEAV
jgi:hypothetical protein